MIAAFEHAVILAGILFLMGLFCAVTRRSLIMMVLGFEIMINAASIVLVAAALKWQHMEGQAFVIFIMAVAAAEVSVGLALIVAYYRQTGTLDPDALGK
ncbi:MAG: NADH-quinone oxidoreductase subunit NuoK [Pseudomonadota bacterium]